MPNRYYSDVHPDASKEGKMPEKGGRKNQTDDGRERGVMKDSRASFKDVKHPNESMPKLGHRDGAE